MQVVAALEQHRRTHTHTTRATLRRRFTFLRPCWVVVAMAEPRHTTQAQMCNQNASRFWQCQPQRSTPAKKKLSARSAAKRCEWMSVFNIGGAMCDAQHQLHKSPADCHS